MSDTKTGGIRIVVNCEYVPERSNPTKNRFFYAYHITIHNEGSQPAKLLGRYWHITDAEGNVEEVRVLVWSVTSHAWNQVNRLIIPVSVP